MLLPPNEALVEWFKGRSVLHLLRQVMVSKHEGVLKLVALREENRLCNLLHSPPTGQVEQEH